MKAHLRANLLLLLFTVIVCSVLYPLVLYAVGQGIFSSAASGNLITEKGKGPDGKETEVTRGSSLIAQKFTADEYFWSRPSAADYNATASGASNWGANNPKLRDRVAQQLGTMVQYKKGSSSAGMGAEPRTPQQDIEAWFTDEPDRLAKWASEFDVASSNWAKTGFDDGKYGLQGEYISQWATDHPEVVTEWKKANPKKTDAPKPEDMVAQFFASYARVHPRKWPGVVEVEQPDKTRVKQIKAVSSDKEIADNTPALCANLFEMWLRDPRNKDKVADIEPVSADMVMASGSGLDPHISLRNAMSVYQLDRVVVKRTPQGGDAKTIRNDIIALVRKHSFTPLSGLLGEPLVNVLELNRDLDVKFGVPKP